VAPPAIFKSAAVAALREANKSMHFGGTGQLKVRLTFTQTDLQRRTFGVRMDTATLEWANWLDR
jgi:hypothetical protein